MFIHVPKVAFVGRRATFVATAHDRFGNIVGTAGRPFVALLDGSTTPMSEQADGSWLGSYTPSKTGNSQIQISINNQQIRGSPFRVQITDDPPEADQCEASGQGLKRAVTGLLSEFRVDIVNSKKQPIKISPDDISVTLNPPSGRVFNPLNITRTTISSHRVLYKAMETGKMKIAVFVLGREIQVSDGMQTCLPCMHAYSMRG